MKRFEYIHLFDDNTPEGLPVTIWLDSYKEAKINFPYEMRRYYSFIKLIRTGRKFRSPMLTIKIKLYKILKSI